MRAGVIALIMIASALGGVLVPPFLPKTEAAPATLLVQKTWGGQGNDTGNAVAIDSSGNMYVVGTTSSFGPRSPASNAVLVLKYASDGMLLWQRIWSNSTENGYGVAVDSSGSVYVTGNTYNNTSSPSPDSGFLFKLDASGNLQWEKVWVDSFTSSNSVKVDSSGNVYVDGLTDNGATGSTDISLIKFDSNGNLLWQRIWGWGTESGTGLAIDSSGNIYLTGYTNGFEAGGSQSTLQLVLLKISSSGSLLFHLVYGGLNEEIGTGIALDSTGNIYVTGWSCPPGTGHCDVKILKFDPTGALLVQRTWGGGGREIPSGIVVDASGNVIVTGVANDYGTGGTCPGLGIPRGCYDAFLLRINPSWTIDYALVYGATGHDDQSGGLALDSTGNPVITGFVGEAGPYSVSNGNTTLGTVNFPVGPYGNNTLGNPGFTVSNPRNGILQTPSGSETYAGGQDVFVLKYGQASSGMPTIPFLTVYFIAPIFAILALATIFLLKRRRRTSTTTGPPRSTSRLEAKVNLRLC